MKKIICNTKFQLNPFGDGGSKRSVQIRHLYEEYGFQIEEDAFLLPKGLRFFELLKLSFRSIRFIHKHYPFKIQGLGRYANLVKYYALRIPIVMDKYANKDIIFSWENTNDQDMLYLMKQTGNKVIGFPHNIESLVNENSSQKLQREIENLKLCDLVFAISKEETWLLRLMGVNAHYLPYYPPREVMTFLEEIRRKRDSRVANNIKHFLILGSATNLPTQKGMISIIDYITKKDFNFKISVAGYRTEILKQPSNPNVDFLGTLSLSDFGEQLVKTDAILIFQPPTSGALTRIPEMLIAGVPVFVNFDASRNYHNVEDVVLYHSFDDLFSKLDNFIPHQANWYPRISSFEKDFLTYLSICMEKIAE